MPRCQGPYLNTSRQMARSSLRGEILVMPPGRCGKVVPQPLRAWLANMELSADRAHGGDPVHGKLLREHFDGLFL